MPSSRQYVKSLPKSYSKRENLISIVRHLYLLELLPDYADYRLLPPVPKHVLSLGVVDENWKATELGKETLAFVKEYMPYLISTRPTEKLDETNTLLVRDKTVYTSLQAFLERGVGKKNGKRQD